MGVNIMAPPGMEDMTSQLQNLFSSMGQGKRQSQRIKVKEALKRLQEDEAGEIRVCASPALEPGGVRIESGDGLVDNSIAARFEQVKDILDGYVENS